MLSQYGHDSSYTHTNEYVSPLINFMNEWILDYLMEELNTAFFTFYQSEKMKIYKYLISQSGSRIHACLVHNALLLPLRYDGLHNWWLISYERNLTLSKYFQIAHNNFGLDSPVVGFIIFISLLWLQGKICLWVPLPKIQYLKKIIVKWGTKYFNTRLPLPILVFARFNVKQKKENLNKTINLKQKQTNKVTQFNNKCI